MAMLNFKKGEYKALPKTMNEGTVYVVTDEKAMYVDISNTERIRLGQIVTVDTVEAWEGLKPPFSHEAFYYIVEDNALMRNNGTETNPIWTQINGVSDVQAEVAKIKQTAEAAKAAAEAAQSTADGAATAAQAAQTTADSKITLDEAKAEIDSRGYAVATEVSNTYATKTELSTEKNNILGEAGYDGTVKGAYEAAAAASTAAQAAQAAADSKTTMADVEAKGYATKTYVDDTFATKSAVSNEIDSDVAAAKSAILGQTNGVDFAGTVKEAYAKADAANTLASGKTTMAEVEAKGYATETYVNNSVNAAKTALSNEIDNDVAAAKTAVLGKNDDNTDFDGTVKGAYAKAEAANTLASGKTTMAEVEAKGYAVAADVTKEIDNDVAAAKSAILGKNDDNTDFVGTLKEAYSKANAAQNAVGDLSTVVEEVSAVANAAATAAQAAQETANSKTTMAEVKTEINNRGYIAATEVANTYATKESVNTDIASAKTALLGEANYTGTIKGAYVAADAASTAAGAAKAVADSAVSINTAQQTTIDDHGERIDALEEALGLSDGTTGNSLTKRVTDLENTINDPATGLDAAHDRIDSLSTELNNYAKSEDVAKDIADAEERMEDAIASAIAENDAMTYKGIVTIDENGNDNLPDGILHPAENDEEEDDDQRVKIGYTYKVSKTGYYGADDILCYVGDLLIANSTTKKEESDGYIAAANLTWDHVESGYEDDNLPKLSAVGSDIMLTSPTVDANTGDLGSIKLVSLSDNLKVSIANNVVNFSLEWGSFTD